MEERHLSSAINILKNLHYMVIATVCEDGSPWSSPISVELDGSISFTWGSSPQNIHSQNIRRDSRAFVVIFDSNAPEGTGEGLYMVGNAWELEGNDIALKRYRFVPEQVWINDEAKNEDGTYKHDIRIELNLSELKSSLNK